MKNLVVLMALLTLTACDSSSRTDRRAEREGEAYKSAMNDYRAGRLDAAITGFERAIRDDPANASARFQLACLLQDSRRDFVGAYCCFWEFLMQEPDSDKAALAKDRLTACEKEMANALAAKYSLNGAQSVSDELARVRKDLQAAEARIEASEKNLGTALGRVRVLSAERERLVQIVKGVGSAESVAMSGPSEKEVKDLLEESEEGEAPPVSDKELKEIVAEEKSDAAEGPSILTKELLRPAPQQPVKEKPKLVLPARPKTYVVQEGDTLYGVAKRFYGTRDVWKKIRSANKALISMDNRLRVGDTLVLPEP